MDLMLFITTHGFDISHEVVYEKLDLSFNGVYSKIEIKGSLYLPQNSGYKLKLISSPGARLRVNNKEYRETQCSSCDSKEESIEVESDEFTGDNILMPFSITYQSECPMTSISIKHQWMFKRWFTDKGKTPEWKDIPAKYIFRSDCIP